MNNKNKKPIKVSLHGIEGRAYKTMVMFLQGPCKGMAVVDDLNAEVDIIDTDFIKVEEVLKNRGENTADKPIVALSLQYLSIERGINVKKPVKIAHLINALIEAHAMIGIDSPKTPQQKNLSTAEKNTSKIKPITTVAIEKKTKNKKKIDLEEKKKTSKHQTAMQLNEGSFSAFIGYIEGVNFNDRKQALKASYNTKHYFLGYVQAAIKVANEKKRVLQLNSTWKPLLIFPYGDEVWLDADEKQLRVFAGLPIKNMSGKGMSMTPVDPKRSRFSENMENFYSMDSFVWKLAIWTSKGRFPDTIDINKPVFLKSWPNFTRLVITPHAIRMTALLVNQPRKLLDVADDLKIKPQYVFVFISAASALGLVAQEKNETIRVPVTVTADKEPKNKGLLGRILGRLRRK